VRASERRASCIFECRLTPARERIPMKVSHRLSFLFALALLTLPAFAAQGAGSIGGHVVGVDGQPVPGAVVSLSNATTGFHAETATNTAGEFHFYNVPFNPYVIRVTLKGLPPAEQHVEVRGSIPLDIRVELKQPTLTESVSVTAEKSSAELETDTSVSHVDVDKSYIARVPAAASSRAMEQIVTSTPGFAKDENGRFHFQGAHSQSEYVVDGQTISDQTGATFSNSIDPGIAQSIEVIYGSVPAEYGEKIGAVMNLATKSGLGSDGFKGDVFLGASRYQTLDGGVSFQDGSDKYGVFASLSGSKSDRFLDPVNPDNLSNHGDTARGFLRLDWAADPNDTLRITALLGQTSRGVPNTFTQEAAGQNQRVATRDQNFNLGWQRILSPKSLFDLSLFGRFSTFRLDPSSGDTPVTAFSDRSLDNYGITPSYTWSSGINQIKVGGVYKRIPIDETFNFGITDPALNDPAAQDYNPNLAPYDLTRGGTLFKFHRSRAGTYYAAYVQDDIHVKGFTANLGLRYDHNDLPVADSELEPRIGLAYFIAKSSTVFRLSYNRVLYTPEYENIIFSSSQEARALVPPAVQGSGQLGGGVLPVRSEVQNAYTVGVQQGLGRKLRLDIDFWQRDSNFAGDQDQFLNTGIVFPLAFQAGKLHGWDVRFDLAETAGVRGFLSAGHTRAIYVAPPVGGLFLDAGALDDLAGGPFLIDHDQALQVQLGVTYDIAKSGFWIGTNVRYDSGLVTGADPAGLAADPDNAFAAPYVRIHSGGPYDPNRIEARTIYDFSLGVDLDKHRVPLSIQVDLLNVSDVQGVYNILSVFGGTHVIPPRTLAGRIRYRF
jgi:hypothetical protein